MVITQDSPPIFAIFFVIRLLLDEDFLDLRQQCGGIVFLAYFLIVIFHKLCLIIYLIRIVSKYIMYSYQHIFCCMFGLCKCVVVLYSCIVFVYCIHVCNCIIRSYYCVVFCIL